LVTRAEATLTRAYYQSQSQSQSQSRSQSQADPTIEETAAHNRSAVAMNNAHDWSAVGDLLAMLEESLARAVSRQTKAHGEQRQVIVECHSLGCAGVELLADAEWLTQAIMALVDNAIKASSAKQAVVIEFAAERVGWITVSVLDRGPGVREELIPNLGRPFFQQLDNAAGSGIGLGLSVAQWVAEQHGGALSLNNRDGGGLVAQIELPVLS